MLKIQKNKYLGGFMLAVMVVSGQAFAQDTAQEVKDNLSVLMADHVTLTLKSLKDSLDEASEQQQTVADLAENTEQIGSIIGEIYDIETGSQFLESWRVRVDYFDDYLMYISSGNEADRTPVIENLAAADVQVASQLASIVSGFSAADAQTQLNSITNLFLGSTEDYAAGGTSSAQTKEYQARTQIGVLSQSLGDGVAADLILSLPEPELEPEPEPESEPEAEPETITEEESEPETKNIEVTTDSQVLTTATETDTESEEKNTASGL